MDQGSQNNELKILLSIENLRKQLNQMVGEGDLQKLPAIQLSQDVVAKAFDISLKVASLSGKLSIYLKSEDDYLYPTLMTSPDEHMRNTAKRFNREMGHIAQSFADYKSKYMSSTSIKQENILFISDSRSIISALRIRTNSEDKELYSLL